MKNNDDLWLKAAVVGGLWAALEIIIGSFLHNTRLPMAGTTLAFAGTVLLIGYYQLWPQKGLIIRAGLITAIMKSVSPSAVILGPMTGILLEAMLIELVILIAGNNIFSYVMAGILSVSTALFHKIVSLLIFYGFDLIKVYLNIINFALKQLKMSETAPKQVLLVLLLFYFVLGFTAAILGYYIGKKAVAIKSSSRNFVLDNKINNRSDFFDINKNYRTSIGLLIFHLIAIPMGLYLLNFHDLIFGLSFIIFYLLIFGYMYRYALRRLRKPVFWSQLIIIVLLSALFWDTGSYNPTWFNLVGLYKGMEMVIRALFIVVAFSSISVELKNEKVRNFLMKVGFGKYYQSIGLAFSALPTMISLLPKSKQIIAHPVRSLLLPLTMANQWLELFKEKQEKSPD
ncbi:MAG: hypothetical protein H8E34_07555 [Bacteroidetes bacterium]|nr:hypothetical protein [Bacteroidota bacterium]MBL6943546.1 hypothetical protein [Bacteroidales bacterium]